MIVASFKITNLPQFKPDSLLALSARGCVIALRGLSTSSALSISDSALISRKPLDKNLHNNNYSQSRKHYLSMMTNKPRAIFQPNKNGICVKSIHSNNSSNPTNPISPQKQYTLANSPNFRNMAGIQRLATEPTREHIENIRHSLRHMNAKDNDDQQITLDKDDETGIASVCIKSAAKNGISCKMMCDLLDTIDELYEWNEGKGVIIYGYKGFFCSGR